MNTIDFKAYHPVIRILKENYDLDEQDIIKLHEQIIGTNFETIKLRDSLIKHKVTSESVFQQAIAQYYEL